jgi:hypothetical protein
MVQIRRQSNNPQFAEEVRSERFMETYSGIKPYLVRLFTHALLLFIAIRGYLNFLDGEENYEEFLDILKGKLVTNVTTIIIQ